MPSDDNRNGIIPQKTIHGCFERFIRSPGHPESGRVQRVSARKIGPGRSPAPPPEPFRTSFAAVCQHARKSLLFKQIVQVLPAMEVDDQLASFATAGFQSDLGTEMI